MWQISVFSGLLAICCLLLTACTEEAVPEASAPSSAPDGSDLDADADSDVDADSDTDSETDSHLDLASESAFETASGIGRLPDCLLAVEGKCLKSTGRSIAEVCDRWQQDMPIAILDDFWQPGEDSCDPGKLASESIDDGLRRVNFYRWIADLSPLIKNPDEDAWRDTANCAVVSAYNESPDPHHPLDTATCYSQSALNGASTSSIDYTPYVPAVTIDRLIFDTGDTNAGTVGHRRSLLAWYYSVFAVGYARVRAGTDEMDGGTCVQVTYEKFTPSTNLSERISAYPPPGVMPHELTLQALKGSTTAPLQWHMNIMDVSFEHATTRLYHQTADGPEQLDAATGILTEMARDGSGIWIQPAQDLPPGEYVVDIDGTDAGAIGYRVVLTDCGTGVPESCDFLAQDCGEEWLGCYRSAEGDSFCMHRGYIDEGEPCRSARFCEPGLVCIDNASITGNVCSPYCDDTASDRVNSCDSRCEGVVVLVDDAPVCQMK